MTDQGNDAVQDHIDIVPVERYLEKACKQIVGRSTRVYWSIPYQLIEVSYRREYENEQCVLDTLHPMGVAIETNPCHCYNRKHVRLVQHAPSNHLAVEHSKLRLRSKAGRSH
eukprot:CAMPEP_0184663864 /NCGR_PEP_ID=MMETSP0308-20130426/50250_1 /TAXON_ID=38269 /ORGANISM="Gloeochaete witrockiana, Strain SAG 46.84" /LENGTH=111 /DNA_ID=CAMNT_0027106907 /DNA_START=177 /DNA_END=512 /DNA_ORIENTATION=+